jgi:hypothetical protein
MHGASTAVSVEDVIPNKRISTGWQSEIKLKSRLSDSFLNLRLIYQNPKRLIMKIISKLTFTIISCAVLGCSTDENVSHDIDSAFIQNEWQTISQRMVMPNGETHLLLCEAENFREDGKFILTYTAISGNPIKDSAMYELQADKITMKFYEYQNGILNTSNPQIAKIKTLNQNLFVYHCLREDGSVMIIDSLGR